MFAEKIGQPCSTAGINAFQLPVSSTFATHRTWRQGFSNGDRAVYLATNDTGTVWEMGHGVFTTGSPDQLTRNLLASSSGALISWATLPYRVYNVPSGIVMSVMLRAGFGTTRPAWAAAGFGWLDISLGSLVAWIKKRWTGAVDIEEGRFDIAKGIFTPSQRRPWTAVGAANKVIGANDVGGIFTFDNAAAARTMELPANGTGGVGHGFTVGGLGLTGGGAYGVVVTPNAGDSIEGGANGASRTVLGGMRFDVTWDGASSTWRIVYLNVVATRAVGRPQTVNSGPATAAGLPSFLPASASGLVLNSQNVSLATPLAATAAGGFSLTGGQDRVGVSTGNLAWTLADNATNYIYVDIGALGALTPGATTIAPVYQEGGTYSTTNGAYTFNIGEMIGKLGNGSSASQVWRVFLGEAVTSGGNISSTVAYAFNGRYDSGYSGDLPAVNTAAAKQHNLGVYPRFTDFIIECTSTEGGYAVGDQIGLGAIHNFDGSNNRVPTLSRDRKAMSVIASAWVLVNKATAVGFIVTNNKWKWRMVAERGW